MATSVMPYGRTYVDPPGLTPSSRGLLYTAEVRTVADSDPALRGFVFDSDSGENAVDVVSFTGSADSTNTMADNPDESNLYASDDSFTVFGSYAGVMPIRSVEEANARAAKRLQNGEYIGVEKAFWSGTLAKHAAGNLLAAGAAVSPTIGVGLLLEWGARYYAGVPYLHTGLRAANQFASLQMVDLPGLGETPDLRGGGMLVPGAGYYSQLTINTAADGSGTAITPTANQVWAFASGKPLLYRGSILPTSAPAWSINQVHAFAQRTYTPGVDGPVAAVLITLT